MRNEFASLQAKELNEPRSHWPSKIRSLFVSDLHLGSGSCQPRALLQVLEQLHPERLYLVGDICDGWLLRRRRLRRCRWYWESTYDDLLAQIQQLAEAGTRVKYTLGYHDRCLQRWITEWPGVQVVERAVHHCADGKRLLVIHGDQFDHSQKKHFSRAANASAVMHEQLLTLSKYSNGWLSRFGLKQRRFATALSTPIRSLTHSVGQFWSSADQLARASLCTGIVCGHTHSPRLLETEGLIHANTGDWLEHCSLIVETESGQMELWMGSSHDWWATCKRVALIAANRNTTGIRPEQSKSHGHDARAQET